MFYTIYANHLIKVLEMTQSLTNMCVFFLKDNNNKLVLIASYHVDDTLIAGEQKWTKNFKEKVSEQFKIKEMGYLQKYFGIKYQ